MVTADSGARGDIQVVARLAAILDRFTPTTTSIDAQDAAEILGVGRSTAHRYLLSMEKSGLLRREGSAHYVLGPSLVRVGAIAFGGLSLIESAGPVMQALVEETGSTIVLSVWGGDAPVVARVIQDRSRTTTVSVEVGRSLEPESAQSLVFAQYRDLAGRDEPISAELFPYDDEALDGRPVFVARHTYADGALKAIAAPVHSRNGELVATIAALGFRSALPDEADDRVSRSLLDAARKLQRL